jgi:hypothetical protein
VPRDLKKILDTQPETKRPAFVSTAFISLLV